MRIGLIAPPWVPVPPPAYGGTEAVVDTIARGLAARGHDVVLVTTGDATCPVTRRWVFEGPPEEMNATAPELRHVQGAYEMLAGVDLVHDHTTLGPVWAAAAGVRTPLVVTVHNPFTDITRPTWAWIARRAAVVAISRDHRASATDAVAVAAVVHHGIDVAQVPVGAGAGGYLAFVGRMSPDKGAAEAVAVARAAGVPLRMAAKLRSVDEHAYFDTFVRPHLDDSIVFLGEITSAERDALVGDALALINPIQWREPFGLAMVEALACGTPVVAFRHGSAAEIVRDRVTGFLCDDVAGAAAAVGRVPGLSRDGCRASVQRDFSADRMVADYEALYARVLDGSARSG